MCLYADLLPEDIPDAGAGECCPEAIMDGPRHCACWTPVYDREQSRELRADLLPLPAVPPAMCPDCAYRPRSPERRGDLRQQCSGPGELDELVCDGTPFYCHQGIVRVVRLVHPSGAVYEPQGDYRPVQARNDAASGHWVPYQADGTPALICSGWFLRRQAWLRQLDAEAAKAS
jgi:hypothetical protein